MSTKFEVLLGLLPRPSSSNVAFDDGRLVIQGRDGGDCVILEIAFSSVDFIGLPVEVSRTVGGKRMTPSGRRSLFIIQKLHMYVATGGMLALTACGGGVIGELDSKPVAADMSWLYYNAMCKGDRSDVAYRADARAVKVEMDNGSCAVMYLDAIDRQSNLLIFPYGVGSHPRCRGLNELLVQHVAHPKVIEKAVSFCVPLE